MSEGARKAYEVAQQRRDPVNYLITELMLAMIAHLKATAPNQEGE